MHKYYTDQQIAGLMGITQKRLRNKLRWKRPLPPRIHLRGCRTRLWPSKEAHNWLENHLVRYGEKTEQRKCGYYK